MAPRPFFLLGFAIAAACPAATAGEAHAAVAANFAAPAKLLAERFRAASGERISISSGSTGKFYAQIRNGAPFDLLLSADDETPLRLENEALAVPGSRFTYAIGKLVLWSPIPGFVDDKGEVLRSGRFNRLAIANPRLAPYGHAARQVLEKLGLAASLQGRLAHGENIAQTFQFVASGNAELGFVALSQLTEGSAPGSRWRVPAALYDPIRQDAVLLVHGERNPAARQFLEFLRRPDSRQLIRLAGYDLP
jgi:molybdate transport system substrate-binding protein